jgi:hypothetical protein
VFRARISTNILYSARLGAFGGFDLSGEAGYRRSLEEAGVRIVTWQRETIAGLPALQIVADAGDDRVYMLYLGETHYNSNTMLVNFHHPTTRSAADDDVWARFVTGIAPVR